ncbi:hypothetical protein RND81_08G017700 [Saponaria officinalis]|uniref:Uncharacterized protein n=1 Tax=Saponaria officinalis TaxID=3572 RepID=A0AAW1J3I5_SAPOF
MKFMKLGSKPDAFQVDENEVRYVASELATDIVVNIADVKFNLHKFPLLSKSFYLQKLVATNEPSCNEVTIPDIPGGPAAFEICVKFCYGMSVTLNAHNVIATRCAAEYLGMHETVEKGNLVYKIDVFLNSVIFHCWKESIIVLQTTKAMLPWSEDLKLVDRCIEAVASKASVDIYDVDWSYTYNRKKLSEENGEWNYMLIPKDWWVEDLCEIEVDLYQKVLNAIKSTRVICDEIIGEALKAYSYRKFPSIIKGVAQSSDLTNFRYIVDTIIDLIPAEKGCVSCCFLLRLLKMAILVGVGEVGKSELIKKIGHQLEQATVTDLLIRAPEGDSLKYDVDIVQNIIREFLNRDRDSEIESLEGTDARHVKQPGGILSEASKLMVAKTIDYYLAEIARDRNLPVLKFTGLAEMLSGVSRPAHDGLYRAIDMFLKEHPETSTSEKKRICRLMDCKKLSVDACAHAVQNERLPMRVIVQVLYFELVRASATSETSTPEVPKSIRGINSGSQRSSRSTPNADEDWDDDETADDLNCLKGKLAALKIERRVNEKTVDKTALQKTKGLLMTKKIFSKIWSTKNSNDETSDSDSSDSPVFPNPVNVKSASLNNRRYSVS